MSNCKSEIRQLQDSIKRKEHVFNMISDIRASKEMEKDLLYQNTVKSLESANREEDSVLLFSGFENEHKIPTPYEAGFFKSKRDPYVHNNEEGINDDDTSNDEKIEKNFKESRQEINDVKVDYNSDKGRAIYELEKMLKVAVCELNEFPTPELQNYVEALQMSLSKLIYE